MFQATLYSIIFLLFFPAIILQNSLSEWPIPGWVFDHIFLLFQLLFLFLFLGLSALQEFNNRGLGTPFPMDKTQVLVITGPYAYLRNPMQFTTTLFFFALSAIFLNPWFLGAAAMTILYSVGYAKWQESADMEERFGKAWLDYEKNLPLFYPRWKPWREERATIYLDLNGCYVCSDLGRWISGTRATCLNVKDGRQYEGAHVMKGEQKEEKEVPSPAENFSRSGTGEGDQIKHGQKEKCTLQRERVGEMRRMIYVDSDGFKEEGVRAFARSLEHINILYALFSFFLRLPIIAEIAQFILDILAPPHRMCRLPSADLSSE